MHGEQHSALISVQLGDELRYRSKVVERGDNSDKKPGEQKLPPWIPASHGFLPPAQHNCTGHHISLPSTINLEFIFFVCHYAEGETRARAHLRHRLI